MAHARVGGEVTDRVVDLHREDLAGMALAQPHAERVGIEARAAAGVAAGRRVAVTVKAIVVPGSGLVREQAEREGLAKIFLDAGFEWREPGCSMCVGMNGDTLAPGQRCAATSNRNFEGRQGVGGRTHLMSPAMAAAAAITGHLTDVRKLMGDGA